ncbi:TIR domain-containing protein [Altererythrobacter salegens]|uniref:TIR domain-containing protein n=1 Tax=Croceibacterium salegens TaxID=1737568 RepID=A0A6I4T1F2_9SPHN|nr:TIR domain-containing protein [Croceibacterium salegens]MXO61298.1 TIR domain-containing protein [Croceibacterium salegens]
MSAPDIFLSYNRRDADRAKHFAAGFAAQGLDVWWDVALRSGEAYDTVTEEALKNAKAVVVLWSPRSVDSRWVRSEATLADRRKTLIPVMIEPCERPIMFELVQTAELSHWHGDASDAAWKAFAANVCDFVGKAAPHPTTPAAAQVLRTDPDKVAIVVLPFANMSRDEDQEYFADGISEDVITDLSKVSALAVVARNTAFTFKGKAVDVTSVARQLNVTHVLEGSVRKAGNRVRVTAQLIDGASGNHVWADRWDRDFDDIFRLQDELSEAIVTVLKVRLLPEEKKAIETRLTENSEAYDQYIRARALRALGGGDTMKRAIEAYRRAIQLDPEFAAAWAGLASAQVQSPWFGHELDKDDPREKHVALARAIELAPDSIDVIAARSFFCVYSYDWQEMEACLALWEMRGESKWTAYAALLAALGRPKAACERQASVCRSDPLSVGASFVYQHMLDCAGFLEASQAEYERVRDLPFGNPEIYARTAIRLVGLGRREEARRLLAEKFSEGRGPFPYVSDLVSSFDQPDEARRILAAAREDPRCENQSEQGIIALWAAVFGDPDTAFRALRSAIVERTGLIGEAWNAPFAAYRGDPRFRQILIDVGLVDHWRKTGQWGECARPLGEDDFEIVA